MSWHWYCPLIGLAPDSGPYDPVTRALCDELLGPMAFKAVEMWSEDLGEGDSRKAGNMLTEFGICVPDSEKPDSVNTIECEFVLRGKSLNYFLLTDIHHSYPQRWTRNSSRGPIGTPGEF